MNMIRTSAAAILLPAVLIATPALAAEKGQIESGDIYRAKNVTKSSSFTDSTTADKCEVVKYRVLIHNQGPSTIENITVKATIQSGKNTKNTSTAIVSSENASPKSSSDSTVVNLTGAYGLNYVAGSTKLLDANSNVISNLPDGIVGGGVNVGTVGVSIQQKRMVEFQAKVDCPVTVTEKPQPQPEQPVTLPETGPAAGLAAAAGTGALGYAVHMYRRSRKALVDAVKNVK